MPPFSRHTGRIMAAALLLLCAALPVAAQTPQAATTGSNTLILNGKTPQAELTPDHRELLLRFPQPIDPGLGDALPRLYPDLVEYVSTGDDQLLIRGKRPQIGRAHV